MRQPALFVAHGSPLIALEKDGPYARALRGFAASIEKPRAIAILSAHWEAAAPARVTSSARPPLIYDFHGFPEELYRVRYEAPGDPALAAEIAALAGGRTDPARGWDHGVWAPLSLAFPAADIPVVEASLPRPRTPGDVLRLGRALAPLRERGVLLVGSGVIVHNLRLARLDDHDAPVDEWAKAFDDWIAARVAERDEAALLDYAERAPFARRAAPTPEHLDPLFFVLGARGEGDRVETVAEGFEYGNLSMRSFAMK